MLTQLVQEMRVGSHIPYRRSESARPGRALAPSAEPLLPESWAGPGVPERGGRPEGEGWGLSAWVWPRPPWSEPPLPGGAGRRHTQAAAPPPVVYYMEGRDSMQLTYRWTKSLDPSLRKGLWAPEEDAVGAGPGAPSPGHAPGPWVGPSRPAYAV